MARWPVKTKPQRVFTGLWKLCARMLQRIMNDNLSGKIVQPQLGSKYSHQQTNSLTISVTIFCYVSQVVLLIT
jgi:hypothetical protein